jgi:hypothetical protein
MILATPRFVDIDSETYLTMRRSEISLDDFGFTEWKKPIIP